MTNPVLTVLKKYFPNERRLNSLGAELFWNHLTLTHDSDAHGVDPDRQAQHLRDLEKGLRMMAAALSALDVPIRRKLEAVHKENVMARSSIAPRLVTVDHLNGKTEERKVLVPARDLVERLHGGLLGEWPFHDRPKLKQKNAIAAARKIIVDLPVETKQTRRWNTWDKVIFTGKVRELWEELSGRRAPKTLNEATPFGRFYSELIIAIGEKWEPVPTFRAWASKSKVHT